MKGFYTVSCVLVRVQCGVNTGSNPVLTTKIKTMKKIINTIGLFTILSALMAVIAFYIGLLWNAPNEGLLHNLFRYSTTIFVILGSIWTMLFTYNELKEG